MGLAPTPIDFSQVDLLYLRSISLGIICSEWNESITSLLLSNCLDRLHELGFKDSQLFICRVPGVFEIPIASKWVLELPQIDGVITLGCVIKGETSHDYVLNHAVSKTLLNIQIKSSKPLALGIPTVNNLEQAKSRTIGPVSKKGEECADVICNMLLLKRSIQI